MRSGGTRNSSAIPCAARRDMAKKISPALANERARCIFRFTENGGGLRW